MAMNQDERTNKSPHSQHENDVAADCHLAADRHLAPCQEVGQPEEQPSTTESSSYIMAEIVKENAEYIQSKVNKNTMRKVSSSQKIFAEFLKKRGETTNMLKLNAGQLDQYLAS